LEDSRTKPGPAPAAITANEPEVVAVAAPAILMVKDQDPVLVGVKRHILAFVGELITLVQQKN